MKIWQGLVADRLRELADLIDKQEVWCEDLLEHRSIKARDVTVKLVYTRWLVAENQDPQLATGAFLDRIAGRKNLRRFHGEPDAFLRIRVLAAP